MRRLLMGLLSVCMLLLLAVPVGAAEDTGVLAQVRAQFDAPEPVSAEASVVRTWVQFQNVTERTECTLRWYINGVLYREDRHFWLESGASAELTVSFHFDNDTPAQSILWVELTANGPRPDKAWFVCPLETAPIGAAEAPDKDSYIVHVIRNQCAVIVYEKLSDGQPGRVVNAFVCSPGRNNWTITGRYGAYDREVWLSLMGGVSGHYATLIWGDFLFHSVPYRGSWNHLLKAAEYNKLGQPASDGCIRLAVSDAKWIFDNCVYGTSVQLFDSEELPVVKPVPIWIDPDSPNAGWDPTDSHPNNPTRARYLPRENGFIAFPKPEVRLILPE
ncbi:MAG: L,D-transpeptidase [Oscillospiraceae bacterium]|nr:L,D-transpeptidase [Oscillospiraceae bacterium]